MTTRVGYINTITKNKLEMRSRIRHSRVPRDVNIRSILVLDIMLLFQLRELFLTARKVSLCGSRILLRWHMI